MNQKKQRTCLKCQRLFPSDGPGHRICKLCKNVNYKQRDMNVMGSPSGRVYKKDPSSD